MPHRDHNLYADFLQGYDDSDGEVSALSTEVSNEKRHDAEEGLAGVRVVIWPILLLDLFLSDRYPPPLV